MKIRKKTGLILLTVLLFLTIFIIKLENKPYQIMASSVFSYSDLTEHRLSVVANTLFPIDTEELAQTVVTDHVRLNGPRSNAQYELLIYRSPFHYQMHWEYASVYCDASGMPLPEP